MKERPILFNGAMVRAILEGRKTQTRRPMKPQPDVNTLAAMSAKWRIGTPNEHATPDELFQGAISSGNIDCPHGTVGDRLWVRETFYNDSDYSRVFYRADADEDGTVPYIVSGAGGFGGGVGNASIHKWTPSIHMPRWASRLLIEITAVRVERVQDITEADARAEGMPWSDGNPGILGPTSLVVEARDEFRDTWQACYPGSWLCNDWVWVVEFKRVEVQS